MNNPHKQKSINEISKLFDEADTSLLETNIIPLGRCMSKKGRMLLQDVEGLLEITEHHSIVEELIQNAVSYIAFSILEQQQD